MVNALVIRVTKVSDASDAFLVGGMWTQVVHLVSVIRLGPDRLHIHSAIRSVDNVRVNRVSRAHWTVPNVCQAISIWGPMDVKVCVAICDGNKIF